MSTQQETYDPTAPDGEVGSRGQYMTRRDMKVILISVGILGIALVPVYHFLLGYTESSRCTQNMHYISEALSFYETEHDGKYPPIDRTESLTSLTPDLGSSGHVYSWASDIAGYMNTRGSFLCPTAKPEETVATEDPRGPNRVLSSSYGMYAPYGSYLGSLVESPDQTVIIAETSNGGAENTFDPKPFKSSQGSPVPDGFVMGWNDSNNDPTKASQQITRLAYPNTADGKFTKSGDGRHGGFIHMLTASGELIDAKQNSATFGRGIQTNPMWRVPPGRG